MSSEERRPRVAVSKGLTLPLGNYASSRVDYRIEADVPAGLSTAEALDDLETTIDRKLDAYKLQFKPATEAPCISETAAIRTGPQDKPRIAQPSAIAGSNADVPELDPSFLDTFPWKSFSSGKGEWIFANVEGAEVLREVLTHVDNVLVIGYKRYRLSGDKNQFIQRFQAEPLK